ncbi:MAG: hypothetical protein HY342_12990 [Candidatus Lambdaproteobacteria bacterium]|nr:hypothetical protein [Candidatus Lambdaproteobacteria bacterium]
MMTTTSLPAGAGGSRSAAALAYRGPGARSAARRLGARVAVLALWLVAGTWGWAASPQEPLHIPIPGGLQGKTCYECHIKGKGIVLRSQERPRKYSLAWAFLTYRQSPHGRLRAMGNLASPTCEDCHLTQVWSQILPVEHPDSPINPANLPRICAKCHGDGMLTANAAAGAMHLELGSRSVRLGKPLDVRYGFLPGITKLERTYYFWGFDVLAYVAMLFLLLTVGTLSVMSIYMVLDLFRKLAERRRQDPDANHERQDQP